MNRWKKRWIALRYLLGHRPYPTEYPDVITEYFGDAAAEGGLTWLGKLVWILPARKDHFTHEVVKNEDGEEIVIFYHSRSWR